MSPLPILIRRELRKRPGQLVAITLLTAVAALLLNSALVLVTDYSHNIERRVAEWNAPTAVAIVMGPTDQIVTDLETDPAIQTVTARPSHTAVATIPFGDADLSAAVQLIDMSKRDELGVIQITEELADPVTNPVWVPQVLAASDLYRLGDEIVVDTAAGSVSFHVQGFTEGLYGGAPGTGMLIFGLPHADFASFTHPGFFDTSMVSVKGADGIAVTAALDHAVRAAEQNQPGAVRSLWSQDQQLMMESATISASIFVAMLVALAIIIGAVAALVIRFVLRNAITTDMVSIGTLRATGHTTGGVIAALLATYLLATAFAAIAGVAASYPLLGLMELSFRAQNGVSWQPRMSWAAAGITLAILLGVVALTAGLSALQLRRVTTVAALRGGIATHSATRTRLPLDQSRGRLATLLGIKSALRALPQSSVVAIAIAAVCFSAVFALSMVDNLLGDRDTAIELLAGDLEDVTVQVRMDADADQVLADVRAMPEVDQADYLTMIGQNNAGITIGMLITPDPTALPGDTIVEGRLPAHPNEIAIGGRLADVAGLSVGDSYTIDLGNGAHDYLVTGLSSSAMHMGQNITISTAGYLLVDPGYVDRTIAIRTHADRAALVKAIEDAHVGGLVSVVDQRANLESQLQGYLSMVPIVGAVVTVLSLVVTALVVGLVVTTMLVRSHRELGIKKAMGFTNRELGVQTRWTILPPVALGSLVGAGVGAALGSPMLAMMLRGVGILKVDMAVNWSQVGLVAAMIIVFAAAITWASSHRIRRISAYALITE